MQSTSTPQSPPPEVPYTALLGQVIKAGRVAQRIEQAAMAAHLGLSQSAYSRLESGDTNMSVWQLRACALKLGTTVSAVTRNVEGLEQQLAAQNIKIVPEKKANPAAALIGLAILAAFLR